MKRNFYFRTFAFVMVLSIFFNLSLITGFNGLFAQNVFAAEEKKAELPASSNQIHVTLKNIISGVPKDTIALQLGIINLNKGLNINLDDIKLRYYFTNDGCSPIQVDVKSFGTNAKSFDPELVKTSLVTTGLSYPGADSYVEISFTGSVELNCDRKPIYIELDIKENDSSRDFDQSNDFSNNNYYSPFLPENVFASGRVPVFIYEPKKSDFLLLTGVLPSETSKLPTPSSTPLVSPSPSPAVPAGEKILATASGNIIGPTPSPAGLFEPADVGFSHKGSVDVGFSPRKKEALILLDSSYESTKTEPGLLGIFKYCLFSSGDSVYQGDNVTIEGDVFTRDTMKFYLANFGIDGKVEYKEKIISSGDRPLGSQEKKMSEAEASRYDRYLIPDENDDYSNLFTMIQDKVTELPTKDEAKFLFLEEIIPTYYPPALTNPDWQKSTAEFFYDDNDKSISVSYNSKESGIRSRKYNNSFPEYVLKQSHSDAKFVLKANMFFDGNLMISVNNIKQDLVDGATTTFIYAYGDIVLQGNSGILNDVYLITKYGNIYIETNNSTVNGVAFAPNGKIVIQGQGNDIQGSFVANSIESTAGNNKFKGPSDGQLEEIEDALKSTEGFDTIRNAIALLPYIFDEYTKAGIITYSDYANINKSHVYDDWKFFNAATEREEFLNFTIELTPDEKSKKSNLGDGLRKALDAFNKYSAPESDKYIYIFTGLDPNAYTISHVPGSKFETDPEFNTEDLYIGEEKGSNEGNEYVREIMKLIDNYNKSGKGKIKIILVDLSTYIRELNIKMGAKESEIKVSDLENLAKDLGLNISSSEEKSYYRPSLEDIQSLWIINELAYQANSMPPKLAVENLKISSAKFELSLPSYLKPVELYFAKPGNTKESIVKLSELVPSGNKYNISYTFTGDKLATLTSTNNGLRYDLNGKELYLTLIVNNSDEFIEDTLTITGTVDTDGPTITYKLYEDKNDDDEKSEDENEFEVVVPFDKIKFNVEYKKDIN